MFKPIGDLFERGERVWQENDVKYFVQEYFEKRVGRGGTHCLSVQDGRVIVRVSSPARHQAVYLLSAELKQALKQAAEFELTDLRVVS